MKRLSFLFYAGVYFCLFSLTLSSGSTVYTQSMDLGFLMNTWYKYTGGSPAGNINFDQTSINFAGVLNTYTNIGSDNTLDITGTLTFISNLYSDYSSGGRAKALFEGGSTVKIIGGLKQDGSYVYGGTGSDAKQIFEATLKPVHDDDSDKEADRWSLEESEYTEGVFTKTLFIELVQGSTGLASGITIGIYILKIAGDTTYPKMKLELNTTETVNNFQYDINSGFFASHVKINSELPEPSALMLIGMGVILLRTKKG